MGTQCFNTLKLYSTVLDNASGLATDSNGFAGALKISRKTEYICVSIIHLIQSKKSIRKITLSRIFNIFTCSVEFSSVSNILTINRNRQATFYIFKPNLRLKRLLLSFSNETSKFCLNTDCSGTNPNAKTKFRTEADNAMKEPCYFNINSSDS